MAEKELEVITTRGDRKVKIVHDGYSRHLFTMMNGFQWSGAPIDDEIIYMIEEVISTYKVERLKDE